jgi:hypothetical protein
MTKLMNDLLERAAYDLFAALDFVDLDAARAWVRDNIRARIIEPILSEAVEAEAARVRHEMDCGDRDPSAVGGCGDNSCVVERPRGMATNGGCRCGRMALRMALQRERKATATAAAAERAALRAEIESRSADAMRSNGEPSTRGFAAGFEARALDSLLAWLDARKDGAT